MSHIIERQFSWMDCGWEVKKGREWNFHVITPLLLLFVLGEFRVNYSATRLIRDCRVRMGAFLASDPP